jgi:hypothetical protein
MNPTALGAKWADAAHFGASGVDKLSWPRRERLQTNR